MSITITQTSDTVLDANCGNCVFAVDLPQIEELWCGFDPPQPMHRIVNTTKGPMPTTDHRQPTVHPDGHCHRHPEVQKVLQEYGASGYMRLRRHSPAAVAVNEE